MLESFGPNGTKCAIFTCFQTKLTTKSSQPAFRRAVDVLNSPCSNLATCTTQLERPKRAVSERRRAVVASTSCPVDCSRSQQELKQWFIVEGQKPMTLSELSMLSDVDRSALLQCICECWTMDTKDIQFLWKR